MAKNYRSPHSTQVQPDGSNIFFISVKSDYMWRIIDSGIIDRLQPGDIIATNPNDGNSQYEIKTISDGLIRAVHYNGILGFKVMPKQGIVSGNWWIKK